MWLINSAADLFAASFSWFCVAVFASPAWECRSFVGGRLLQHKTKMEERVSAFLLADTSCRWVCSSQQEQLFVLTASLLCHQINHLFDQHLLPCFSLSRLFFRSSLHHSAAGLTFHQQQQQQSCLVLLTGSIWLLWLIKRRSLCWSKISIHHPSICSSSRPHVTNLKLINRSELQCKSSILLTVSSC